jgi:PIN domain nuclease of toxin-antitoxin system
VRLLLDTCTFLWVVSEPERISAKARELFVDPSNEVLLSVVSCWEITVKHALGRLPLPESPGQFVPAQREAHGIQSLPLDEECALHVARLPNLHADPFDRMLVSQAIVHGLALVSPDKQIARYPVRIFW